ncbi:MAG TPA: TonB-dependent receptor, partial [Sphingomicrobium sp.]|nr:TonB-dependent receptor [Sphingomicrobium sp.]
ITEQNVAQFLRTLHGSDIERIEIITNPSAQYSAEGTAGIINIVLRKKTRNGLTGSAMGELSSFGAANGNVSLKYKKAKWTYELNADSIDGRNSRSSYHKDRSVEISAGKSPTINAEDGRSSSSIYFTDVSFKATRAIDDRTKVSAKTFGVNWHERSRGVTLFTGITPDFASFSERLRTRGNGSGFGEELAYDHKGKKEGETLQATAMLYDNPMVRTRNAGDSDQIGAYRIDQGIRDLVADFKVDWVHPMGKGQILSTGGEGKVDDQRRSYGFSSSGSDALLGPAEAESYRNLIHAFDVYTTFQQPIGSWTMMPGPRLEYGKQRISSPGRPTFSYKRTNLFPTFHLERPFGKTLDLTLSYAKRIDYVDPSQVRPYPVVESVDTISLGNPHLRDQKTDAYEINLHYHLKKLDAGVIVYDRVTKGLWVPEYTVNGQGLNVYTTINAGHRLDRGAEIDVSSPVLRRLKLTTSVNLFDSRTPTDTGMSELFRYTTNSTLEWDGPSHAKRPGDIAQLQLQTQSPLRYFQYRWSSWTSLGLNYTHSFTKTLSLTATANRLTAMHSKHRLTAPLLQEYVDGRYPPEFKIKILKTFGAR